MSVQYCCSQCSFTAQFESALTMHHELHHEPSTVGDYLGRNTANLLKDKSHTIPRVIGVSPPSSPFVRTKNKVPARTSVSATRLFGKLKAKICKSKTLFSRAEEPHDSITTVHHLSMPGTSECTSKALKAESVVKRSSALTTCLEDQEIFPCHLCSFDADRITVLDRHLLNHHKIGLESLLKLVMAKTKDGLADDITAANHGIRQPYYRPQNEMIQDGEFVIETVTPKIKIVKHASTNTDRDLSLQINCKMMSEEIESLLNGEKELDNESFLSKMQTLNDCMCKFVDSSKALKRVLNKELDSKVMVKENLNGEPLFNMGLGDTPRDWERAYSDKMERSRNKHGESCRGDKQKPPSDSFYF